jgi:hypothetical protein
MSEGWRIHRRRSDSEKKWDMPDRSSKFIYSFFILFLCILLSMFLMFTLMVHYERALPAKGGSSTVDGDAEEAPDPKGGPPHDLTALYRANLFAIDLCLIVLAEAALIILFVKFTIPAALLATVAMLFIAADSTYTLRARLIPSFMSQFITNGYATLTHTDLILLIILSGLIMAFLVSVLLTHAGPQIGPQTPHQGASSLPPPAPPPQ